LSGGTARLHTLEGTRLIDILKNDILQIVARIKIKSSGWRLQRRFNQKKSSCQRDFEKIIFSEILVIQPTQRIYSKNSCCKIRETS